MVCSVAGILDTCDSMVCWVAARTPLSGHHSIPFLFPDGTLAPVAAGTAAVSDIRNLLRLDEYSAQL